MEIDYDAVKEGQRKVWAAGNYPELARNIAGVADVLLERVGARPGEALLDVATGAGNVAIPAAAAGASVTGLDLTPELLRVAEERAREAGVKVSWIEGDAEQLPFEDGSYDRVTSCFGVIFAPRHELAAGELARVARPGARVAFTAWTPEGLNGRMFKTMGSHMPPPPPEFRSPLLWGTEDHVRSLFEPTGAELAFERHTVPFTHDSVEGWVDYNTRVLGPAIMAKAALEPQGKWDALERDLIELYRDANEAEDGSMRVQAEYLLSVAQMRS